MRTGPNHRWVGGTPAADAAMAAAVVDEWARAGVSVAALSPGSRSTPMALALAADDRIRLEVFLDERSASFFALGAAKASGYPAVVLCTSGTAAAELHAAVVEASQARVPLLVATADRPAELRDTGAPQTINQAGLFGSAVRWFADVPAPADADRESGYWRSMACRAAAEASGPDPGPVHLNLAFREPLVADPAEGTKTAEMEAAGLGRPDGAGWTASVAVAPAMPQPADVAALADRVAATPRGLVVAGWGTLNPRTEDQHAGASVVARFAAAARWPILADPLSGLRRGPLAISTYDALLRHRGFARRHRPDLVLSLGAPLTSAAATAWLDGEVPRILVDPAGAWADPVRSASMRVAADPIALLDEVATLVDRHHHERAAPSPWLASWLAAEAQARGALDTAMDASDVPFEGRIARDVVSALPDGATLVVGSSMPVRDVESFAQPRSGIRFLANRGANGIDGFVSTALGVAVVSRGPVVALCGDLTFLHDVGGLLRAACRHLSVTFVVIDNDGGGIFSFLPQAGAGQEGADRFETLFGTPHGLDLAKLAEVHGIDARRVTTAAALPGELRSAWTAGGVRLLVVPTERTANAQRHRHLWAEVARAYESPGSLKAGR